MEKNFAGVLSRLRKEKKLSQKEAAASLGISQALLSHYENGIRECGLDFLIRAADFYNVTTDYLLGRSGSRQGFNGEFSIDRDINSDSKFCTLTIFRAASRIREYLSTQQDEDTADDLHRVYGMRLYRLIISEVEKGNFPRSWLPNFDIINNDIYAKVAQGIEDRLITHKNTAATAGRSRPPECVKTLINHMQRYVAQQCAENGVTLPEGCVCEPE